MKTSIQTISPCLWFDHQAEQAARYYAGIFKRSKITTISRYPGRAGKFMDARPARS